MALGKGTRSLLAAAAIAAAILGSGHVMGRLTAPDPEKKVAAPTQSPGNDSPGSGPGRTVTRPNLSQVARISPITGPNRPPLPAERGGPFGSRKSTGFADVALTFDDGPDPDWTPKVLELLRKYQIKATFCVIGVNVDEFPQVLRQIVAEGHTLCNHSYNHDIGLGMLSAESIRANLVRTNNAIQRAAPGTRVSYYRQPGGAWTPTVVAVAKQLGMSSLHWRVDPQDWRKPGSTYISSYIAADVTAGAIVLMHDGGGDRRGTVDALRSLLPNLVSRFILSALPPGVDPPRLFGIDRPLHPGQE
ncbi:peptidoglycan/xylan/chitin deacetylase (PgdA/CDA1 family) [Allocatelliglobosispora scoriae]|uniref:Peptidoglycan/xylan/chitin deacetylase (PgdA/CDA1 family) n=1 Tax=Allocatelliglobosispora scoriae TaxID=643052 RepID=A0A841BRY5_9ACTN|nr:polysaccharide deacetylase family protein [Allocatelliglobosispora scoriae]MBB5869959.1 peptidoglycan/xylan/chitin deacetylase (PgdA/CDA1 family) [Allocatelliglobosispora scoriae]